MPWELSDIEQIQLSTVLQITMKITKLDIQVACTSRGTIKKMCCFSSCKKMHVAQLLKKNTFLSKMCDFPVYETMDMQSY